MELTTQIAPASVFLVSGGARGITAQCVLELAKHYQYRWILLGRSELNESEPIWAQDCFSESELKKQIVADFLSQGTKPTPRQVQQVYRQLMASREIRSTLASLEQLGARAEYLSVDITDAEALKAKLIGAVGNLDSIIGIIHGAGNLADKWIEKKTEQDFEKVYGAKVKGLENLLRCVPEERLNHLVLFSSVAGFFGNVGQSDYALANEILNKSAHLVQRYYPNCHAVAIDWGPWDSGMVTPELKKIYAQRHIEVIPLEVGAQILAAELSPNHQDTAQVLIGSPITPLAEKLDEQLRSYRIRRHLTLEANPFLNDHVIGGQPVLPATCAAAWMIDSCAQLYPGYLFSRLEKFQVLKGIVFDQNQASEYNLDVQEVAKNDAGEIIFEVSIWSETNNKKIRFHYRGQVLLQAELAPSAVYSVNRISERVIPGLSLYQNKTLFHGASFQGVEQVTKIDEQTLLMECRLASIPEEQQGQFIVQTFNPFTTDVVIQSILIWMQLIHQSGALPMEIQDISQFGVIPWQQKFYVSMEVQLKTDTNVVAKVTAYDEQGKIYALLSGVKFTISKRLNNLFN